MASPDNTRIGLPIAPPFVTDGVGVKWSLDSDTWVYRDNKRTTNHGLQILWHAGSIYVQSPTGLIWWKWVSNKWVAGTTADPEVVIVPPPPPPPPPSTTLVYVHTLKGLTDCEYLCKSTRVKWKKIGGDWLDKSGVFNGPLATVAASGATATVTISSMPNELLIQGINSVSNVIIDGVDITANCFWTDPTSNSSLSLPSHYGNPVIVPNAGGVTMIVTGNATGAWRVDPIALPSVPDWLSVGTYRAPDIFSVPCTSDAAMLTTVPGTTAQMPLSAGPDEFLSVGGIPFVRVSVDTGLHPRIINMFLPLPNLEEVYVGYAQYIEDDVFDSMVESGIKMSGPGGSGPNETFHLVGEHSGRKDPGGLKNPLNRGVFGMDYYVRDTTTGGANPRISPSGAFALMRSGRWYWHEVQIKLNTPGVKDGIGRMWLNGNLICDEAMPWRVDATSKLKTYQVQVYHGGTLPWSGPAHYGLALLCASKQYIGVSPEVKDMISQWMGVPPTQPPPPEFPAWRTAMTNGVLAQISGSANLSPTGVSSATVNAWNGFVAAPGKLYYVGAGGHLDSGFNGVLMYDLMLDAPVWSLVNSGSASASPTDTLYYGDGKFASRHTYFNTQYIASRNRLMLFGGSAVNQSSLGTTNVDGYDLNANTYDAEGTWADAPFIDPVSSVSRDPRNDNVYMGGDNRFAKWTAATATWSTLSPGFQDWHFKGACIDASRNRWVHLNAGLQFIDLTTPTGFTSGTFTGAIAGEATPDYAPIIHDTDNDRYICVYDTRMVAINPTTFATTVIGTVTASTNGTCSRLAFLEDLGVILYQANYATNIYAMPTR